MDPSLVRGTIAGEGLYHGQAKEKKEESPFNRPKAKKTCCKSACPAVPAGLANCCRGTPCMPKEEDNLEPGLPEFVPPEKPEVPRRRNPYIGSIRALASMAIFPWLTFVLVTCVIALFPPTTLGRSAAWIIGFVMLCVGLVLLQVFLASKVSLYMYLGVLIIIASLLGMFVGDLIFDGTTLEYWLERSRAAATKVDPSKASGAVADAASLKFVDGTRVDLRRTLGYRSAEEDPGGTYCVAPIFNHASAETGEARFWAVGVDCCEPSWGFSCGDSLSSNARSGVVIRDVPGSKYVHLRYKLFRQAAEQAASMYQFGMPEDPVFVEWVEDAEAAIGRGLIVAVLFCSISSLLYLMLSILIAGILQKPPAPPRGLPPTEQTPMLGHRRHRY